MTLFFSSIKLNTSPSSALLPDQPVYLKCRVEEALSPHNYILSQNYIRLHLYLPDTTLYSDGDSLLLQTRFSPLSADNNLSGYNQYLKQKRVSFRMFPTGPIYRQGHSHTLINRIQHFRNRLLNKTDLLFTDSLDRSVIKALCLGYKNDLSVQTRQLFSQSGTIHLLAISGLHTGAVWLLLTLLLRSIGLRTPRIRLLVLPLLWIYAVLTGLSPSVVRAAQILTFISIGQAFARDYSALNFIAASAFFTLLFNPAALYSVSMQMSYAAYSGIICLYPHLKQAGEAMKPLCSRLYATLCASLAAQLATFPLTAYYFHFFSLNSFLINILAIPLTTLLLYSSLLLLLLPLSFSQLLALPVHWICCLLFFLIRRFMFINFTVSGLYPTVSQTFLIYLSGLCCFLFLIQRNRKNLYFSIISLCLLGGYNAGYHYQLSHKTEIILFHIPKGSCILLRQGDQAFFLKNNTPPQRQTLIQTFLLKNKLRLSTTAAPSFLYKTGFFSTHLIQTDQDTIQIIGQEYKPDISNGTLIITDNILPEKIWSNPDVPSVKQIILDASNHSFCRKKWEEFCRQYHIPFHAVSPSGTFILRLP